MFDLITAHDFYAMLVQDFDDFMEEPHSARRAVHCAISAHHLTDWIWHDKICNDRNLKTKFGVSDLKEFAAWVDARSIWMTFIHDIANGTKHVRKKQSFEAMRVVSFPLSFDTPHAGFDEGTWDAPVRYVQGSVSLGRDGKGYLLIDLGGDAGEHRWLYTENLLEVVVRFWRDFFRLHLPLPELLVSKRHVD
jgi:hypothetical protein